MCVSNKSRLSYLLVVVLAAMLDIFSMTPAIAGETGIRADQHYAPTTDWSTTDGPVNLSQAVYHDRNASGIYDLGDLAMSRAYVELHIQRDDGSFEKISHATTNSVGFGNFKAWVHQFSKQINRPGTYRFTVIPPPGWRVTSNNGSQLVRIISKPETRSQLFLEDHLAPVGLAQNTWIAGTLDSDKPTTITLRNPDGSIVAEQPVEGDFRIAAEPGQYRITAEGHSAQVELGHFPLHIGQISTHGQVAESRLTATFDDLPQHGLYKLPNGYLGLQWTDINSLRRDHSPGVNEGYVNGVVSGSHTAYTSQARHGELFSDQPFDFVSVYLSLGWMKAEGQEVLVEMWRGDDKIVSHTLHLSALGPIKYAPHVKDVTRVRFSPERGWQVVFDDLTIARCTGWRCWF